MKKQTFEIARKNAPSVTVDYYPLIFTRGVESWRLALHREPVNAGRGEWVVSDPVSGYRVCRVTATHKGVPVSSKDLGLVYARAAALVDLDTTVDRVGLSRFSTALNEAQKMKA